MNKRQKIIVSITGITLVLLILVGLTYAYFLTRIQGNTNTKSISVTTADLRIVYADGNANVITKEKIIPGTVIGEKDFTVTNEGNSEADYIVVIDDVIIKNLSDNSNTTFNSNDFVYTLTCVSKNKDTGDVSGTCDGLSSETSLPLYNNGLLITNKIAENIRHEYVLTVTYKETNENQSEDMNKKLEAKVDIKDIKTINPYSDNQNSLAYNIINNAMTVKNGTELRATPLTKPAERATMKYLKGNDPTTFASSKSSATNYYISYADDYTVDETTGNFTLVNPTVATSKYTTDMASTLVGKYAVWQTSAPTISNTQNKSTIYKISTNVSDITTTIKYATINSSSLTKSSTEKELSVTSDDYGNSYYYRGGVEDNYVNFAGMCWRIVRIEGDGSVKLLLEDSTYECNDASFNGNWSIGNTIAFGYDSNNKADFLGYTGGLADALKTYQTTLNTKIGTKYTSKGLADYLKVDEWCFDHNVTEYKYYDDEFNELQNSTGAEYTDEYYGAYTRIHTDKQPSNVCTGTKISKYGDNTTDMYVGTLTADEIAFAGGKNSSNTNYYIMNTYAQNNYLMWWALSPGYWHGVDGSDFAFSVVDNGSLGDDSVDCDDHYVARPAVSLKSNTTISGGDGTKENPYVIN